MRVYKALPSYEPERASMRTWLTRVVVNACNTHRRRNFLRGLLQHTPKDEEEALDKMDSSILGAPEAHALQSEVRNSVREAILKLRHEHRTVLILHYYLDLSCQEIASILDCPE